MSYLPGSAVKIVRRHSDNLPYINATVVEISTNGTLVKVRPYFTTRTQWESIGDVEAGWVYTHPPKPKWLDAEFRRAHRIPWVILKAYAKGFDPYWDFHDGSLHRWLERSSHVSRLKRAVQCCTPKQREILRRIPAFSHLVG